ncbi:D-isomer specific 2-hydroxyacid dehydrogenase [Aspergillus tamarii]|uniref:D-isomer specific 2-hydroxyacid dehydrogenase n=1 Tax=Aspergillus tamarii TaxID=41984 RepID=A0A5N6V4X0_ASPTM|nr:D-isomer specific 2-hydroxyacid dehydrogenase [Aspergillus tamarii]
MPIIPGPQPFILFFNPVRHAVPFYQQLQKVARTEVVTCKSREEFYSDLQRKYKDISIIYRTSASGIVIGNFDVDLIQRLPSSCKHICHSGADPVIEAIVDLLIWLMLAGKFKTGLDFGRDPQGKILGILGDQEAGRTRRVLAEYVSFEKLLAESNIISVNVPLNAQTKGLIAEKEISQMKDGAVIVNTARGAIIDEAAMAKALDSGKIASVGLDVYENEPRVNECLLQNDRALMVPHLGTHTVETLAKMETWAMENARRAALGEKLLSPVPEHIRFQ